MPENTELEGTKKPWLSKTLVGILVALFWLIADPLAAMFGLDIAFLKDGFQFPEDMVPIAALFVAFYGRVVAKQKIG